MIALLDDDDEWHTTKLARQLDAVDSMAGAHWIASSRMSVLGPGTRRRTWPRRLIQPGESITEYLFRFTDLRFGGAALQTSTLCFPADLAREVRWDAHADAAHDEPSWLIRVQRTIPDLRVVQLPDVLSTYNVQDASVSRDTSDRTDDYIDWGLQYLATESPRVLGDYLCTSPVSAAVSARSLRGVRRSMGSAVRHGRPGPFALAYAVLSAARIVAPFGGFGSSAMTVDQDRLAPEERRALLYGPIYRILGTPVVAALGLANTAIIVRETGEAVFGLVSLVATIALLFPFADLGIGATVLSASAQLSGPSRDPKAADVIRRAYRVLFAVAGVLIVVALCVMALDGWAAVVGFSSGPDDRWAITVAACIFALTIPAGLGVRILIGIDRNPLATLVLMSCPAFALGLTLLLYLGDVSGIWYAVSSLAGLLIGLAAGHGARAAPLRPWLVRLCPRICVPHWARAACRKLVAVPRGGRAGGRFTDRAGSARAPVYARAAFPVRPDGPDLRRVLAGVVHRRLGLLAGLREAAGGDRRDGPDVVATHRGVRRDCGDCDAGPVCPRPVGSDGAFRWANRRIRLACIGFRRLAGWAGHTPTGQCPTDPAE